MEPHDNEKSNRKYTSGLRVLMVLAPVALAFTTGLGVNSIKEKAKHFDPTRLPVVHIEALDVPFEALEELNGISVNFPAKAKRSKVGGGHYSAGVFSSHLLKSHAPSAYDFYWNGSMADQVASIINRGNSGNEIKVVPVNKTTANILISYSRPGDHIGFHYDTYATGNGRMINVIVHVNATDGSCSEFQYYRPANSSSPFEDAKEGVLETVRLEDRPAGSAVVFEGSTLYHRVTPQCGPGEDRLVWSTMFVVTEWKSSLWCGYLNLVFDLAYRGFRQTVYDRLVRKP